MKYLGFFNNVLELLSFNLVVYLDLEIRFDFGGMNDGENAVGIASVRVAKSLSICLIICAVIGVAIVL